MANKKVNQLTSKPAVNLTDLFLIADPTSGQAYKTTISDLGTAIGSGVSSVNGLVGAVVLDTDDIQELVSPTNKWFTDTRARAALSASSPLTYNSGTGVFGIQVANGSQNGYLSSADWTTFNAKQAALSGTGFVKSTGGTISYDTNTYLTTSAAASTYLALAGGTMTGALFGASASFSGYVGFNGNTSPLYPVDVAGSGRFSGDLRIESTNPRIYLTDTDNNPDYFISNTDGTFTVYDVTNSLSRLTISTSGATFLNSVTSSGYYLTGMTSGSGALYYNSAANRVTVANYNTSGIVVFEVNGGAYALTLNSDTSATFAAGGTFAGTLTASSNINLTGDLRFQSNVGYGIKSADGTRLLEVYNTGVSFVTPINGTSATFSSSLLLNRSSSTASTPIRFATTGTNDWFIGQSPLGTSDSNLYFYSYGTSSSVFTLTKASGAATFSSSVTASSLTSTGDLFLTSTGAVVFNSAANFNTQIYHNSGALVFYTGANERMRITSAGNVGIGTTSPTNFQPFGYGANIEASGGRGGGFVSSDSTSTVKMVMSVDGSGGVYGMLKTLTNHPLMFATNDTERMRITSGGVINIGTSSQATNKQIQFQLDNTTNYYGLLNNSSRKDYLTINGGDGASYTSGANITLIGSDRYGTNMGGQLVLSAGNSSGDTSFGHIELRTSGSERARITSGGNVLIGTTSDSGYRLTMDTSAGNLMWFRAGVSGNVQMFMGTNSDFYITTANSQGVKLAVGATSWSAYSDIRLKNVTSNLSNALENVNTLNAINFTLKSDLTNKNRVGLIAQEVQKVLPEAVDIDEKSGMLTVRYTDVIPLLVASIKELKSKIETLENK